MRHVGRWLGAAILCVVCAGAVVASGPGPAPVAIEAPAVALANIESEIVVRATELPAGTPLVLIATSGGEASGSIRLRAATGPDGSATFRFAPPGSGPWRLAVETDEGPLDVEAGVRAIPAWWSLAPPVLAIAMALLLRQVVPALFAGVWLGAWIGTGAPLAGFLRTLDTYVVGSLADPDHASILLFSLLLGGMVGIVSRAGGTLGLVESLARRARTSRGGQVTTWILGIAVFFDDYANTLVVGNAMRPVTDRLRVSREKLAYIVDSTAAPVAAIALITTWIGAEVSYIAEALGDIGSDRDAYVVFLRSIPYNFYPILALVFGFAVAATGRDFGPMLGAERRARRGLVLREGAQPLSDFDAEALQAVEGRPRRWQNAVVPVLTVVAVTLVAQWSTGRAALVAAGDPQGLASWSDLGIRGAGNVFSSGDSYKALLWAAFSGCLVAMVLAVGQRILSLADGLTAWVQGMKSMIFAMIILILAWSIAGVCDDLHTASFVADFLSGTLDPRALPALVFLLAAATAFATGTSWGTMGLLIPIAVPSAFRLTQDAGLDAGTADGVLLGATAAVLSGAIFGDHCSPISDTTVLSSMASGCDHVDHVRTQLPYALTVGLIAVALGYLPEAVGLSPWWSLVLGSLALLAIVRFVGSRVDATA